MTVLKVHELPPHHALSQEGEGHDVVRLQVSVDNAMVVKEPKSIDDITEDMNSMDHIEIVLILSHELSQIWSSALEHQADHGAAGDRELVGIGSGGGEEGQRVGCGQNRSGREARLPDRLRRRGYEVWMQTSDNISVALSSGRVLEIPQNSQFFLQTLRSPSSCLTNRHRVTLEL
jgi:hypothetical protein